MIKSSLGNPVISPVGLAMIFAGLEFFVAGVVMLITSAIDLASAVSKNGLHKREMLKVKKRLLNFNILLKNYWLSVDGVLKAVFLNKKNRNMKLMII